MSISFDFSFFWDLASKNPLLIMWILFYKFGWVIVAYLAIHAWWILRLYHLNGLYAKTIEYVLLAIDIPKDSEQTPKAMEQVFATISGAHSQINLKEKYLQGVFQLSFSFEIISIDGYVQFLIRTPKVHRDLIESAIYAHYPDAEITEVYDYTADMPKEFPNDQYKLWGSELELVADEAFPIRTYETFEDKLSQELKDPLAGVLETMTRIQKGEQVWLQIIVVPTDNGWVKKALAVGMKIAGKKTAPKKNWYDSIFGFLYHLLDDWISWIPGAKFESKKDSGMDFKMLNLMPGERAALEAIERKASKIGFICKVRLMYLAPPEQFQAKRVVSSVFGGIKQFGDMSLNAFKPNKRTKTQVVYFNFNDMRINERRRRIMSNYKNRSWYSGSKYFILNTEELATMYHFPSILIKTPLLKRTEVKKSESPMQLPTATLEQSSDNQSNLRDQLTNLNLDNDYYERAYAKYYAPEPRNGNVAKKIMDQDRSNDMPINTPDNLPIV